MTVFEGALGGLGLAFDPAVLPFLGLGAVFGLFIGVIPGLSGHFAMAIVVTFLYAMEPAPGIAFLLAAHATVAQGGGLTAILFSTPGTGQNAATLLDGPKMRDNGQAGVAIGAAMTACFMGATFGALVLALLIPVLREVVLVFGPPEIFMLAVLGLIFVAVLGRRDLVRSLIAGLLGLFLALVGVDNATNAPRFALGFWELEEGFALVPVVLGLFAVAEMISLWRRGGALNPDRSGIRARQGQVLRGIGLAIRHWKLVIRSSTIGTTMGIIPGLGSAPASFVAYAHAKATSKTPDTFEHGNVEGVIAPEAANDAVEGGALASTVAFGIPGSSSMAILLSGLLILGLQTGPSMLNQDLDILFLMIFTIVLGNLIGTVGGLVLSNPLMLLTSIPAAYMVPVIMAIVVTGAYAYDMSLFDVGVTLGFGLVGYVCSRLRYSRAALLIGFVLGSPIEYNLHLALQLKGPGFILQPVPLALGLVGAVFVLRAVLSVLAQRKRVPPSPTGKVVPEARSDPRIARSLLTLEALCLGLVGALAIAACYESLFIGRGSAAIPMVVLVPLILLLSFQSLRVRGLLVRLAGMNVSPASARPDDGGRTTVLLLAILVLPLLILVLGHLPALFIIVFVTVRSVRTEWAQAAPVMAVLMTLSIHLLFQELLGIRLFQGLIARYFLGYEDFGWFDAVPAMLNLTGVS